MKMELHEIQIVGESLCGQREIDEQTYASVSILAERLERVKNFGKGFSEISFSPEVEALTKQKIATAVC